MRQKLNLFSDSWQERDFFEQSVIPINQSINKRKIIWNVDRFYNWVTPNLRVASRESLFKFALSPIVWRPKRAKSSSLISPFFIMEMETYNNKSLFKIMKCPHKITKIYMSFQTKHVISINEGFCSTHIPTETPPFSVHWCTPLSTGYLYSKAIYSGSIHCLTHKIQQDFQFLCHHFMPDGQITKEMKIRNTKASF